MADLSDIIFNAIVGISGLIEIHVRVVGDGDAGNSHIQRSLAHFRNSTSAVGIGGMHMGIAKHNKHLLLLFPIYFDRYWAK